MIPPYQQQEFRQLKQRLSAVQIEIKHAIKDGLLPKNEVAKEFITLSLEMNRLGKPEWQLAMNSYISKLERFQTGVESGDFLVLEKAFKDLLESKITSHKAFRHK